MKEEQDNTLKLYHNQYLSFVDLEKLDDWEKVRYHICWLVLNALL